LVKSDEESSSSDAYAKMARYYDLFSSKYVDYRSLTTYLERIFAKHKKLRKSDSILDVACGTGNYTFMFAKDGYKVTGIDLSKQMIQTARRKAHSQTNPRFLEMDMRQIALEGKYDVVTVLYGGFGYLRVGDDVEKFLAGVSKCLNHDGLLVFEFWQDSAVWSADARPSGSTTWEKLEDHGKSIIRLVWSKYDSQTNDLTFKWDLYVLDIGAKNLLDTFSETHVIRVYTISHIRELLERGGFQAIAFYDVDVNGPKKDDPEAASPSTFRVLAVAKLKRANG